MFTETFIKQLEAGAKKLGTTPAIVSKRACGNWNLYQDVKSGKKSCTLRIAEQILAYVDANT